MNEINAIVEDNHIIIRGYVPSEKSGYKIKMLSENEIKGILPVETRRINDEKQIYIDITGRESLARYFESREAAEEFALRVLKDAAAKQLPGGRDRIISAAKAEGYVMTQKRAREILKGLQERGYVAVGKGRNGSMITEAGMRYLK